MIANNDIVLHPMGAYYGIYSSYSRCDIWFNSIHMISHNTGYPYGIYVNSNNKTSNYTIKYNDVAITGFNGSTSYKYGYPIYVSTGNYTYTTEIEDNNMYCANGYVGYFNKVYSNINTWMTDLGGTNSTAIRPNYADSVNGNKWADYTNGSTTTQLMVMRMV